MPNKVQPIQTSFSSGEITPLLQGQVTSERYATGLEICSNFLPRPQGPADLRNGRLYVDEFTGDPDTIDARIFPLNVDFSHPYVVAVDGLVVEVFDRKGVVLQGNAGIDLVFNDNFALALLGWSPIVQGSGAAFSWVPDFNFATLSTSTAGESAYLTQAIQPNVTGNHVLTVSVLQDFDTSNRLRAKVGISPNDGSILNQTMTPGLGQQFVVNFADTTQKWVTVEVDNGSGRWLIDAVAMRFQDASPVKVTFPSPYGNFVRWRIAYEQHPTAPILALVHPNVAPQELKVDASNNWTLGAITFTGPPSEWTGTNFPGAVTFGESGPAGGRMWLGGTPNEPTTFWGSKSNDYYNFTQGTQPEDGLQFTIAKRGPIRWMSAARRLVIGTETNEYIVNAEGGVIAPDDVSVDPQSAYGSFAGQHAEVGEKVVYASSGERKLRVMGYQWQQDAWTSVDLAWPSENITEGRIGDLTYAKDPIQTLWMNDRLNFNLLAALYDREQGVVGWAKCPTPGDVLSVTANEFAGVSETWTLTRYVIDGLPKIYLERFDGTSYLDAQRNFAYAAPTSTVTGLDYLEGRTVGVKVDFASHPDRTVSGGQITLEAPGTFVEVGLKYQGRVKTLPLEGGNPRGTSQGVRKRYNRIWLRIHESVPPRINGELVPDRDPQTPMDLADTSWSEDIRVVNLTATTKAQVEFVQDKPFKTTVLALFGEVGGDQP